LGPALVSAIEIASTGSVGSKVIICTDGEANVGLGANYDQDFYNHISEYAKSKRVGVSVLSIKGDNCNLKLLGKVSQATNGLILKVDPQKLGT
jgi:Mg-chelatase subunit ChlD